MDWRRTPWVMSMISTSGFRRRMTPFMAPTYSLSLKSVVSVMSTMQVPRAREKPSLQLAQPESDPVHAPAVADHGFLAGPELPLAGVDLGGPLLELLAERVRLRAVRVESLGLLLQGLPLLFDLAGERLELLRSGGKL